MNIVLSNRLKRYLLPSILLILVILSNIDINHRYRGELSFVELFEALILMLCCIIQIKNKRLFLKRTNKISYFSRLSLFIILLYEELSFVTQGKNALFNTISMQSEINFHNNKLLFKNLFSFTIPLVNQTAYLNGYVIGITMFLLIIGFGSYFNFLKSFRYFFLEQKFAIYSLIFIINIIFTGILSSINPLLRFMHGEFCELFIYILLLLDTLEKKDIFSKKSSIGSIKV
tara:strand:- start:520 stop:1209 length:690 start_codon:yes stop_codon:yes gene_type:complete